jgi:hypothetical protein
LSSPATAAAQTSLVDHVDFSVLRLFRSNRLASALIAFSMSLCAVSPHAMSAMGEAGDTAMPMSGSHDAPPCPMHPDGSGDDSPPPADTNPPTFACCGVGTPASVPTIKGQDVAVAANAIPQPAAWSHVSRPPWEVAARMPAPPGRLHLLHGCFLT